MGDNRRSRVTAIGLAVMLLGVSAGVGSGELGLLLGLVGVLVGANTIAAAGVLKGGEEPTTPTGPAAPARLGALTAFLLRNLAVGASQTMGDNRRSRVTAFGLAVMLLGVSAGVGSSELGLLLGLVGVLIGANTIAAGVCRMGEDPTTPTGPAAPARLGAFTAFLRRNLAVVGIILSSAAVTAVSGGEAGPVFCFAMFTLFLLGLCFINIRVVGEE